MKQLNSLKLVVSKYVSAEESMASDTAMFKDFESDNISPTLRIYSFKRPSVTLGYSQKAEEELDIALCKKLGIDHAKRPTGGGILFHTREDIAFGLIIPESEEHALSISSLALVDFLSSLGISADVLPQKKGACLPARQGQPRYCFSYPSRNEIAVSGKKIVGLAQKVGKRGVLQQGAIFVSDDSDEMLRVLKKPFKKSDLLSAATNVSEVASSVPNFKKMSEALAESFEKCFEARLEV